MGTATITVHRLERYTQKVEVEVDDSLPEEEQARQALELVSNDEGTEVGEPEFHSTDPEPNNWSIFNRYGKLIR